METLTIDFSKATLTDQQFYYLCRQNESLRFEMTAQGDLIVMSPVGGDSGRYEMSIGARVWNWNEATQLGQVFSSSTIFRLPSGAKRSPDVAWVEQSRWDALPPEEQERFPPIAPDFVIELCSSTNDLKMLQVKMQEYLNNGVKLGWLIDHREQAEIYEQGQAVVAKPLPAMLSGGMLMPDLMLNLKESID